MSLTWSKKTEWLRDFTGATLSLGRALSETTKGTGYQAAITPPCETAFGLIVYSRRWASLRCRGTRSELAVQ
jgi:hypothetical protein